ncbi:MAG: hypothetical protein ABSB40_11660 [Nitrososphaeria archaeon]
MAPTKEPPTLNRYPRNSIELTYSNAEMKTRITLSKRNSRDSIIVDMIDFLTYIISWGGILVAVLYFLWYSKGVTNPETYELIQTEIEEVELSLVNGHENAVLIDYQETNNEIKNRGQVTLLVGSIMITSSFLILAAGYFIPPMFPYALVPILLFVLWLLILHWTTKKIDQYLFRHVKTIELALRRRTLYRSGPHQYILDNTTDNGKIACWLTLRRLFSGLSYCF